MPARKDRCVEVQLPPKSSPYDLLNAVGDVMISVQSGALTPLEGDKVMALLERCQKLFASVDLEKRIEALEQKVPSS